jgi:hypothetical protein
MSDKPNTEPPKKRRFWQIHLSTLLIVTLATGLMLLPNICFRSFDSMSFVRGWPYPYGEKPASPKTQWIDYYNIDPVARQTRFVADVAILIALVLASASVCEWIVRRREARRP